jgi:hypothetical protein
MCIVDVALFAVGVGEPAAGQLQTALAHSPLPEFNRAQLGPVSKDYPDLVVAATLGSALAGHTRQLTAAVLVAALSCANGVFLLVAHFVPATAPVGIAAAVVGWLEWRSRRTRRGARGRVQDGVLQPA